MINKDLILIQILTIMKICRKKDKKSNKFSFRYKSKNLKEIKNKINEEFKKALEPKINTPKNANKSNNNSLFTKTINNEK